MNVVFYISGAIAVVATFMAISRANAIHGLLYMVLSLLSLAIVFFSLGAPFVAALEVVVYAGAIVVLILFVVMMLNLGPDNISREARLIGRGVWVGPGILGVLMAAELVYILAGGASQPTGAGMVDPKQVGLALYGPYLIGVELASTLLLAGLIGAYHLGRRHQPGATSEEE